MAFVLIEFKFKLTQVSSRGVPDGYLSLNFSKYVHSGGTDMIEDWPLPC